MSRSRLGKSFVFKRFYEDLSDKYGDKKASAIWAYAQKELRRLEETEPGADKNSLSFVFPAVALYRAVEKYALGEGLSLV